MRWRGTPKAIRPPIYRELVLPPRLCGQDLDAALAEAEKAGHPVVLKMQEPGSRYAYIQDPNGIWIELAQFG